MNVYKTLNCKEAKKTPITVVLENLGIFPDKIHANQAWYKIRDEKHASCHVNMELNIFYDFGLGIGGDVIKLIQYIKDCTVKEALEYLANIQKSFSFQPKIKILKGETCHYQIIKIIPIEHKALIEYAESRCINIDVLKTYCWEVHYKMNANNYFGLAFKNNSASNSYEVRSKYFKGVLGAKNYTLLKSQNREACSTLSLIIFEGFIDFLSFLTLYPNECELNDFLILNSTALVRKALQTIQKYNYISCYLDNDETGEKAFKTIKENTYKFCWNKSDDYKNYKDLNEFLMNSKSADRF